MNSSRWLNKSFQRILVLILSLALLVPVAACIRIAPTPTPTPAPMQTPTITPTTGPTITLPGPVPKPTTTQPTTPTSPSAGKGILNLTDQGPSTLDPAKAAEATSASYIFQIFSGLVRFDENLKTVPDIAQSWDKSIDGTKYTFHLRQDVKFHDGKQVKASDFKYSWERALNPATQSITAGTYLNDIVGAADVLSGKATQLSGVRVVNDSTLEVTIDAPKAFFLNKMAYPTAFVLDRTNVQSGGNWWQRPNGTGAFKLKQWQPGQLLVLQRNDNYYGDKAFLSEVNFRLLAGNPVQNYQEGSIDVADVPADYMGMITDPTNPTSKELVVFPELSIFYVEFNSKRPPFDDPLVRQAFSYAVDKERLVKLAAKGTVTPAYGVLPPGMPGYDASLQGLRFDPQKAKELIAASKYGDVSRLPPIVWTTAGWGGEISGITGGVIEEWRRNLGVEVTLRQLEGDIFPYVLMQEKDNLFDTGWIADYPDPQDFLDVLFRTGNQYNYGEYSNPQLDALLDKAAVEQNPDVRLKLYQDAERIIVQDAPILPLFFGRSYVVVKPYVKGYVRSPLGYPLLNKVSIQK